MVVNIQVANFDDHQEAVNKFTEFRRSIEMALSHLNTECGNAIINILVDEKINYSGTNVIADEPCKTRISEVLERF